MNRARPNEESGSPQITQIDADFWRREIHLRKSAKSADSSDSLRPREIEVHIDELILHGFDPGARWQVGDAIERELRGLLTTQSIPPAWLANPERIEAGAIPAARLTNPVRAGVAIAGAAYGGGAK